MSEYLGEQALPNLKQKVEAKQDKLVSGENIKTVNGQSVLGEGNIEIEGGGGSDVHLEKYAISGPQRDYLIYLVPTEDNIVIRGHLTETDDPESSASVAFATIPAVSATKAGLMTPTDKTSLTTAAAEATEAKTAAETASATASSANESAEDAKTMAQAAASSATAAATAASMANDKANEALAKATELSEPITPEEEVATKEALDEVDTTGFTGGETYEVKADETQGGKSTIYVWNAETQQWDLNGEPSPYVTKDEFNETIGDLDAILTRINTGAGV